MNDDFIFDDPLGGLPPIGNPPKPANNQPPGKSRMDILNQLYSTVFGRAPDSNAVMYYMGLKEIDENKIRQQMVESAEHKKIIEDSKQLVKAQADLQQAKTQALLSDRQASDRKAELENLNKLLYQKNQEIIDLRQKLALIKKEAGSPYTHNSSHHGKGKQAPMDSFFTKLLKVVFRIHD